MRVESTYWRQYNYGEGGGTLIGQPEEVPPQLPLNNDNDDHEEPNLELHL